MKSTWRNKGGGVARNKCVGLLCWLAVWWSVAMVWAAPGIVWTDPASNQRDVPTDASVFVRFSEPMDASSLFTLLQTPSIWGSAPVATLVEWSADFSEVRVRPAAVLPPNTVVALLLTCNAQAEPRGKAATYLTFYTGQGASGGTGIAAGTNAVTVLNVGKVYFYDQDGPQPPVPSVRSKPFRFLVSATLASNVVTRGVQLTSPNGESAALTRSPTRPELFGDTQSSVGPREEFEALHPDGTYRFEIQADAFPTPIDITFSPDLSAPEPIQILNFDASQRMNPTKPFVIRWAPIPGGRKTDHVRVLIGGSFASPAMEEPGSLDGTSTSYEIPASVLQSLPSFPVAASVLILRLEGQRGVTLGTAAYKTSLTQFFVQLGTGEEVVEPVVLTPPVLQPEGMVVTAVVPAGKVARFESMPQLDTGTWVVLQQVTGEGQSVRFVDPSTERVGSRFYRVVVE